MQVDNAGCVTAMSENVNMPGWGDWWTSFCRLPGLSSYIKGQVINVPPTLIINSQLYSNATLSPTMTGLAIKAAGFDVTRSKGDPPGMSCTNPDGVPHGFWVQEHMAWGRQIQTVTYSQTGSG
jgi:hypothetical protein